MLKPGSTFLIVGLGLMGGSYAIGLKKAGHRVLAVDLDQSSLEWAAQNGIVDAWALPQGTRDFAAEADAVVLALYPKDVLSWIEQNKAYLKEGAVVTDLIGVKSCFVEQAQELLFPHNEFIPCHPMAGKAVSGVKNADDAIFKNANFIITPTERNTPEGIAFARTLADTLGFARITTLDIQEHDRMIGYVSQLTHAIAVSLMNANDDPRLPMVTGDSFRDLTRVADINGELWSELFLSNADILTGEIDAFMSALANLRQKLADGDKQGLMELFATSTQRRRRFNKT